MEKYTIEKLIIRIVEEKGIEILEKPDIFCGIIDDLAPYLVTERKIFRRALTPKVSEKLLEIYRCAGDKKNYLLKFQEYLKSELGMSQEWSNNFIAGFSEAFGWNWSYSNQPQISPVGSMSESGDDSVQENHINKEQMNILSKTIAAGAFHVLAIREDGKVIAKGDNRAGQCNVSSWVNTISVATGPFHSVGLKNDGTVYSTKITAENSKFDVGQCNVGLWKDIIDIGAGDAHTVGLKVDGTVVATGSNRAGQCDVSEWSDIISVSVKGALTLGLKSDGTVVSTGVKGFQQGEIQSWHDIVLISAGGCQSAGLHKDGYAVITNYVGGNYRGQCDVQHFNNICMISTSAYNTVGLKVDGTVLSTEYLGDQKLNYGQCDVSNWTDIIAVSAGGTLTLGLRRDGSLVAAGDNHYGQCDISGCKLFYNSDDFIKKIQQQKEEMIRQTTRMCLQEKSYRQKLIQEKEILISELKSLKGLFSVHRKNEINARLQEIEQELLK